MAQQSPLVCFVIREDSDFATDVASAESSFQESRGVLVDAFDNQYGFGYGSYTSYSFLNDSWKPLSKNIVENFVDEMKEAEEKQLPGVVFVIRGWDGITADTKSFLKIFDRCSSMPIKVHLRAYADEPPRFFDVDVTDICTILTTHPYSRQVGYPQDTVTFVDNFLKLAIRAMAKANPELISSLVSRSL
ncbi:hypothetical protein N7456_000416 [Penicillium angulare]|uniref:Uncharacterized protein n=1 Tax=Penicillium angulare TaxID=116970 RepID=A0A9W9GBY9_9EURO|nr:hypothetical protein N7456_000416 [Penicillium angulare]